MRKYSQWTKLEIINGWKSIKHFKPPRFIVNSSGAIDFDGIAQPGQEDKPFAKLPLDIEVETGHITRIGFNGKDWNIERLSVDVKGYLSYERIEKVLRVYDESGNPYFVSKRDFE